jgi:hypothetical protein
MIRSATIDAPAVDRWTWSSWRTTTVRPLRVIVRA